jgi:dTDP-4-amino-4,6-dideoxygalactose transaminase
MSINFYNLKEQYEDQRYELQNAIMSVSTSGQYFANESVAQFESLVSRLYDRASCVGTNSGTSALTVAIKLAKIPKDSLVAIPAMTYVATANAVVAAGCHPICIDIDEHWLMDYDMLREYLDKYDKIAAVIVVDLYGQGVDLSRFKRLCDHFKVKLIVDAAQSFEIMYDYYHQIDYCDSLALSFNPLKNLGAMGNAGAIVSKNYTTDEIHSFCAQGKLNGDVVHPGFNCRIDAIQAAVLMVKYLRFDDNMRRKAEISWYYREEFRNLVEMPEKVGYCAHNNYVFVIAPKHPDMVKLMMGLNGIEFASHYEKPVHHYEAFKNSKDYCPNASALAGRCVSIPNHWHLTDIEVDKIVTAVRAGL